MTTREPTVPLLITLPKVTRAEAFARARATVNAIYASRPAPPAAKAS